MAGKEWSGSRQRSATLVQANNARSNAKVQIQAKVRIREVQQSQRQAGSNAGSGFRFTGTTADQKAKYQYIWYLGANLIGHAFVCLAGWAPVGSCLLGSRCTMASASLTYRLHIDVPGGSPPFLKGTGMQWMPSKSTMAEKYPVHRVSTSSL